eukprot:CAMPEP_0119034872 /NCGR_PEP_ID=MMETSP1177-20130426/1897_1 /TAXON_ID=2985 /ORGANISM="Ochromonas sp, Strain CCMP1899" /LENGTH=339 /DNA_ID=CAMNT_0006992671 /DNA_START=48 /DNA_END=1064 /DNA_ORIENTATION=+
MSLFPRLIRVLQREPNGFKAMVCRNSFSTTVTSSMVKELREKSGAPMMECKKALSDASVSGDIEKAMNWLRMKGIARASQGERISQEGLIAFLQSSSKCTLIEVNSETDFVGQNEKFHTFVAMLAQVCNTSMPTGEISIPDLLKQNTVTISDIKDEGITTIAESLGDIVSQIRENIVIRRALNIDVNDIVAAGYVHGRMGQGHLPSYIMMGKTAALVELSVKGKEGNNDVVVDMGRKLAMHVVAASPTFLKAEDVPSSFIDTETALFRQQSEEQTTGKAKPKEIMEKIIQGKVNKRLSELCLLSQTHVAEEGSPVIAKFVESFGQKLDAQVTLSAFHRW